ncbi:UDP-N-acetylglucosamine 2-epimerase [Helicobacter heilmannii]|uniref:UDP-N-acetylglucosamine 2-epimerase n=1 Tax=Helicobacter heilmannii TaxID=35817 RepID=UPI0006A0C8EC|nr:UDP-N-acetylglucosamine 2-epimerase [Helicobacter heilmannii]CRF46149.1 UDP-N-acetylglucosamine 2-epimerase, putative [Helicobacter heilmannii]
MAGKYGIFLYHPVVSEIADLPHTIYEILDGYKLVANERQNFVCIYHNNDLGSEAILNALETLQAHPNFVCFLRMKFGCFLTLLKNAEFILCNSSTGIREVGVYGVSCLNLGSRQHKRSNASPTSHRLKRSVPRHFRGDFNKQGHITLQSHLPFWHGCKRRAFFKRPNARNFQHSHAKVFCL